ncbi:MAG: bifunctional aspartate kinase/homoserine dehydrogenase I [Bacteroidota bacterium]
MQVVKFGGTSVANAEHISKVVAIVRSKAEDHSVIAVVSALGGMTDTLQQAGELAFQKDERYLEMYNTIRARHLDTARELGLGQSSIDALESQMSQLKDMLQGIYLINEFSNKTRDKVLGFGELWSSFIIAESIRLQFEHVERLDSRELIVTDNTFTQAQLDSEETYKRMRSHFAESTFPITIMPGFVSRSVEGEPTTLGRGGSDFTAAIVAGALQADVLEIWTDVSGMYTANPSLVRQAFPIAEISYEEAMELSHFGAKVLYPPTIRPVLEQNIPIRIKNTFDPAANGTLVNKEVDTSRGPVKGISHLPDIALLTLEGSGMVGIPGFSRRLFEALATEKVNVVLITQASSEHSICVAVQSQEAELAETTINAQFEYERSLGKLNKVVLEEELAIVAVIGDNMKNHQGISGKMFSGLGKNNVNIRAIAQGASERNISAVIAKKDVKKALNVLHYRFFEKQVKTLHLFVVGVGNVGKILLEQIQQQQSHLYDHLLLNVKVVGLSNSRRMVFDSEGIDLATWEDRLADGATRTEEDWLDTVRSMNLQNSIFIDITANAGIAATYSDYLRESISVIACNKIACSSDYAKYQELKALSRKYNVPFLFETNVGAGLPVINTLNNLVNSGDQITSIKAVLSGSLNFIFNNFSSETQFHDVVKQAQQEGYTEPDPRIDLSGVDVARKILILARESGTQLDMEAIENQSFLPRSSQKADTVDAFYETLKIESAHFNSLLEQASNKGCRLKYVASFTNGKASVGLEEIEKDHPFYNLDGKDNIVLFYTHRYADQPLIIKGAGAGAAVTASGLFGDIISLGRI